LNTYTYSIRARAHRSTCYLCLRLLCVYGIAFLSLPTLSLASGSPGPVRKQFENILTGGESKLLGPILSSVAETLDRFVDKGDLALKTIYLSSRSYINSLSHDNIAELLTELIEHATKLPANEDQLPYLELMAEHFKAFHEFVGRNPDVLYDLEFDLSETNEDSMWMRIRHGDRWTGKHSFSLNFDVGLSGSFAMREMRETVGVSNETSPDYLVTLYDPRRMGQKRDIDYHYSVSHNSILSFDPTLGYRHGDTPEEIGPQAIGPQRRTLNDPDVHSHAVLAHSWRTASDRLTQNILDAQIFRRSRRNDPQEHLFRSIDTSELIKRLISRTTDVDDQAIENLMTEKLTVIAQKYGVSIDDLHFHPVLPAREVENKPPPDKTEKERGWNRYNAIETSSPILLEIKRENQLSIYEPLIFTPNDNGFDVERHIDPAEKNTAHLHSDDILNFEETWRKLIEHPHKLKKNQSIAFANLPTERAMINHFHLHPASSHGAVHPTEAYRRLLNVGRSWNSARGSGQSRLGK